MGKIDLRDAVEKLEVLVYHGQEYVLKSHVTELVEAVVDNPPEKKS